MRTYDPQPLLFFPAPYPGESIYSVLCRYHVRSGNATNRKTILQLFGVFGSLCSTLLLPSMMTCFHSWTANEPTINADYLFRNHTAYSLCSLRSFSEYGTGHFSASLQNLCSWRTSRWNYHQCLIQHPSDSLRYCPACADSQRRLYGESYWQILPQLDGVEYCPVHGTRIASTSIHTRDLIYSFYPADTVISENIPVYFESDSLWYREEHTVRFPQLFIAMAKVVAYLWENLPLNSGIWSVLPRYRAILSTKNEFWQSTECVRKIFTSSLEPPPLIRWLVTNITSCHESGYIYPCSFTLSEHAMMISMLSDSPQHFFDR